MAAFAKKKKKNIYVFIYYNNIYYNLYTFFLRYALWAAEFLLVWNYLENFAHCSVNINPCVLGVSVISNETVLPQQGVAK